MSEVQEYPKRITLDDGLVVEVKSAAEEDAFRNAPKPPTPRAPEPDPPDPVIVPPIVDEPPAPNPSGKPSSRLGGTRHA